MKEVFANFFAAKIVNPSFPDLDHDLRFLFAHYPAAYEVDRTAGTHPIRQPLDNLENAGTLYGALIYQKAPVVMRQLERMLGEGPFRDGMREYLGAHAFANASWPDLIRLLDGRTPRDLAAWSRAWVEEAGRPVVRTAIALDGEGRVASLALEQSDPAGSGRVWPQAVEVILGREDGDERVSVALDGARVEVPAATGRPAPLYVLPTGGGLGYGDFVLDEGSRAALVARAPGLPDALTRGAVYVTLWEDVVTGRLAAPEWMAFAMRALAAERDEQNITRLLAYSSDTYWRRLGADARDRLAPTFEQLVRDGIDRSPTRTAKAAWFQALARIARTPATLDWLTAVWRREAKVEGLPLGEPDEIALSQELALREVPAWREVLDAQQGRITNPDRRARFAFVRPSLDADPAVRAAFFEGLREVANRRREPWVLEALNWLHHPLRAAQSERFVAPSLAMLEEIQRTGDIFFPKRWLDATLGGHRSRAVARMVTDYLEARPDLSPRLRRILLQSADDLLRAQAGAAR
jgi:aminopeptidase N